MDASDIIEVHQLLGLYGHVVDAAEWDRFDELFEADAVLDYTGVRAPRVFHGHRRDPRVLPRRQPSVGPPRHQHRRLRGATARSRVKSKFFAPYTRPTHDPLRWYGGDYDDVVVRTPDGWRFRRRVCTGRWQFTPGDQEDCPSTAARGRRAR